MDLAAEVEAPVVAVHQVAGDEKGVQMKIPNWLKGYLNADGAKKIEQAVLEAEKSTSAEIVPVLIRQSMPQSPILFFFFVLSFGVVSLLCWFVEPLLVDVLSSMVPSIVVLAAIGIFAIAFAFVLARFLAQQDRWKWLAINTHDAALVCQKQAHLEFYRLGLTGTKGRSGILIFVSLVERQVIVLADKAISEKYPRELWRDVTEKLLTGLHKWDMVQGFSDAIKLAAEHVKKDFPITARDRNELSNRLVIVE